MNAQLSKTISRKRRHSDDALKRSAVACDRCRGRKTRCAGRPPDPCAACIDAGRPCNYSDSDRRVTVSESYLQHLRAQAQKAEAGARNAASNPGISTPKEVDFVAFTGTDNWVPGNQGEYYYMGNASSTYIANKLNPTTETLAWHMYPHYDDTAWLRRSIGAELPQLPPYEFAKHLYLAQYAYIGIIFSFLSSEDFYDRLKEVYIRQPDLSDKEDCLMYCQVLLVLAMGQMYSVNQWSGNDGPPGFLYFKHALKFLPDVHEDSSILFVEVLSYVGYYMQALNRRDAAYLYLGLALRMAVSLGLHQEVSNQEIGSSQRERKRRVWWSTYSLERLLCVTSGHPISIQDDDIDLTLTCHCPNESPRLPLILRCYTQLSRILGRVGEEIYRRKQKSGTSLTASVQNIMNCLSEWFSQLPDELRLEPSRVEREVNRETMSLHLYYYQCINMTARPLLLYAVNRQMAANAQRSSTTRWEDGLPSGMVSVVHAAIAAARSSTSILKGAARFNLIATYGFIDGEQAFSAALLLVMVNIAFPYNEMDVSAMDTSLLVLQGMADRGNQYIRACHSLLTKIREVIKSRNIAQEAVIDAGSDTRQRRMSYQVPQDNLSPSNAIVADLTNNHDSSTVVNFNDDPGLWSEILGSIGIDMDRQWIEAALISEDNLTTGI
ncbi:fungal-specific transcription factor domain-containing protein [Xylogone sp. PMI_703]|nr:fungal-specific transcription factor domain-containing protein [Xylogone sp. PMI_703]